MSEQTAVAEETRERRAAGEATYLAQIKNEDDSWTDLRGPDGKVLKVPGGTRRVTAEGRDGTSVLDYAVDANPDEFAEDQQGIVRLIRLYQAEKDMEELPVMRETVSRAVVRR